MRKELSFIVVISLMFLILSIPVSAGFIDWFKGLFGKDVLMNPPEGQIDDRANFPGVDWEPERVNDFVETIPDVPEDVPNPEISVGVEPVIFQEPEIQKPEMVPADVVHIEEPEEKETENPFIEIWYVVTGVVADAVYIVTDFFTPAETFEEPLENQMPEEKSCDDVGECLNMPVVDGKQVCEESYVRYEDRDLSCVNFYGKGFICCGPPIGDEDGTHTPGGSSGGTGEGQVGEDDENGDKPSEPSEQPDDCDYECGEYNKEIDLVAYLKDAGSNCNPGDVNLNNIFIGNNRIPKFRDNKVCCCKKENENPNQLCGEMCRETYEYVSITDPQKSRKFISGILRSECKKDEIHYKLYDEPDSFKEVYDKFCCCVKKTSERNTLCNDKCIEKEFTQGEITYRECDKDKVNLIKTGESIELEEGENCCCKEIINLGKDCLLYGGVCQGGDFNHDGSDDSKDCQEGWTYDSSLKCDEELPICCRPPVDRDCTSEKPKKFYGLSRTKFEKEFICCKKGEEAFYGIPSSIKGKPMLCCDKKENVYWDSGAPGECKDCASYEPKSVHGNYRYFFSTRENRGEGEEYATNICCDKSESIKETAGGLYCKPCEIKTHQYFYGFGFFSKESSESKSICCDKQENIKFTNGIPEECKDCSTENENYKYIFGLERAKAGKGQEIATSVCCDKKENLWFNIGRPVKCESCGEGFDWVYGFGEFKKDTGRESRICCSDEEIVANLISRYGGRPRECSCPDGQGLFCGKTGRTVKGGARETSICCTTEDKVKYKQYSFRTIPMGCCPKENEYWDEFSGECKENCCETNEDCPSSCKKGYEAFDELAGISEDQDEGSKVFSILVKGVCTPGKVCEKKLIRVKDWLGEECIDIKPESENNCGVLIKKAKIIMKGEETSYCKKGNIKVRRIPDGEGGYTEKEEDCDKYKKVCVTHKNKGEFRNLIGRKTEARCEECSEIHSISFYTSDFEPSPDDGHKFFGEEEFTSQNSFLEFRTPEQVFQKVTEICNRCPGSKITLIMRNHGQPGTMTFGDYSAIDVNKKWYDSHQKNNYNFNCIDKVIPSGCSVGQGDKGDAFLDRTKDFFGASVAYAATDIVRWEMGSDPSYEFILRGGVVKRRSIFYATRDDLVFPGIDEFAYQTDVYEGELGDITVTIDSSDRDKIIVLHDEELMSCDYEVIKSEEFEITDSTEVIRLDGFEIGILPDSIKEGEIVKIKINKLATDCSDFKLRYDYSTEVPTKEYVEEIKSYYDDDYLSKEVYERTKSRYENNWVCIADEDCYGLCPIGILDCVFSCEEHKCVAVKEEEPGFFDFIFGEDEPEVIEEETTGEPPEDFVMTFPEEEPMMEEPFMDEPFFSPYENGKGIFGDLVDFFEGIFYN